MHLKRIWMCGLLFTGCATAIDDESGDPLEGIASYEEIYVTKDDLARSAVNLEVHAIEPLPGESTEAAVRRVLGARVGTLGEVIEASAAPADPNAAPEPEAEAAPNAPAEPRGEAPQADDARCDDTCIYANDGVCDDGRPGSAHSVCARGADCADCRGVQAPDDPPEQPPANPAPEQPPAEQPPAAGDDGCSDTCEYANDGVCDDGRPGSAFDVCARGTDCADCRDVNGEQPPAEPPPANDPPAEQPPAEQPPANNDGCSDTCEYAHDGVCDDGRPGAAFDVCARGTDCADCRNVNGEQPPAEQPPADNGAVPGVGGACNANGQAGVCRQVANCGGRSVPGQCPGAADVQCCVADEAPPADNGSGGGELCVANGQDGTCMDTSLCAGNSVPGFCPGAANIQCCVDNDAAPGVGVGQVCETAEGRGVCEWSDQCDGTALPGGCSEAGTTCCVRQRDELQEKALCGGFCVAAVLVVGRIVLVGLRARSTATVISTARVATVNGRTVQMTVGTTQRAVSAARANGYNGGRVVQQQVGPRVDTFFRTVAAAAANAGAEAVRNDGRRCSDDEHRRLQDRVNQMCKQQAPDGGRDDVHRSCTDYRDQNTRSRYGRLGQHYARSGGFPDGIDTRAMLQELAEYCRGLSVRIGHNDRCYRARQDVMNICYPDSADDGHREAAAQALGMKETCVRFSSDTACSTILQAAGG